jgi:hypothetical protein
VVLLDIQNRFLVERVPLFKDCELSIIMQVLQHLTSTMYMPGDYVVRAGDVGDSMYFIRSGLCKILMPDLNKGESNRSVTFFADVTTSKGEVGWTVASHFRCSPPTYHRVRSCWHCYAENENGKAAWSRGLFRRNFVDVPLQENCNGVRGNVQRPFQADVHRF